MNYEVAILVAEAVVVYLLVLGAHSLRHRVGLAHFYALIGGLTAVMSWVTDAGVLVQVAGVRFMVGSTVFYTSLLLAVFVVYVFDGVRATRIAISTVIGVSIMVPIIAVVLNLQMTLAGMPPLGYVPSPSLRINAASVLATFMDLLFLAIAWEFMNNRLQWIPLGIRAFFTLLGVMWLDVFLFTTGAFGGSPGYVAIMQGTAFSRFIVSCFAAPILWAYLAWQNRVWDTEMTKRPVLAILRQFAQMKQELTRAQLEIERRKKAERALRQSEERLRFLATTDELTSLPNRRRFWELANSEFQRAQRYGSPLTLGLMDIDIFKDVNDTKGHAAGDQVLAGLARVCLGQLRSVDSLARVGGEEFVLLLPETGLDTAMMVAERLRAAVEASVFETDKGPVNITVSIGLAPLRQDTSGAEELYTQADQALYQAKGVGRNRVCPAQGPQAAA
ncbi:MAG: GGDEF domain-containing protein [Desulfarculaceae bacterium]|nr:GGDEF domain-containing protein [Desulfarculaceae bacterium]MCF8073913.1 GGDEF domain-containing protein [Desulfarculaceae bacterium]MCF8102066.1 GGDEF domain-containing protein [Desulfarculaceae bacterium]MCF8116337.1 GGDEF domain-containing protein [Desulfarculaceae bacterium]